MKDTEYIVCRDNIYVGKVVKTNSIYRYENKANFFRIKSGELSTRSCKSYRNMLFVPNKDKFADDLLYDSPNYPILNITNDKICLNLEKNSIIVKDTCNLSVLLEYFGYDKNLTFDDIIKIRETFFTGRFAIDNCELFGYIEDKPEDIKDEIPQLYNRTFRKISKGVLPDEYFYVLDGLENNNLNNVFEFQNEKADTFAPHKEEGPIKKLKRL